MRMNQPLFHMFNSLLIFFPRVSRLWCYAGLQVILPGYLRSRFIQAALNYVGCKSEGQFVCKNSDCWCDCSVDFPQCNCPRSDLATLENNLLRIRDAWRLTYKEFEESGESEIPSKWDLKMSAWKVLSQKKENTRVEQWLLKSSSKVRALGLRSFFFPQEQNTLKFSLKTKVLFYVQNAFLAVKLWQLPDFKSRDLSVIVSNQMTALMLSSCSGLLLAIFLLNPSVLIKVLWT